MGEEQRSPTRPWKQKKKKFPIKIEIPEPDPMVASFGCGSDHAWVITKHGNLWMWGVGYGGQLGRHVDVCKKPQLLENFKFRLPRSFC
jgi:alpha-tubulin suppressor-like RCC1 family protein